MKPANYAPVYAAAMYPDLAGIAREHGYALAVHGSLARDFDLIAIPWVEEPQAPQALLDAIADQFAAKLVGGPPSIKAHGRVSYTLSIGFGECFVDLSFMPEAARPAFDEWWPTDPVARAHADNSRDLALIEHGWHAHPVTVAQPANTDSVPGSPARSGARPSEQDDSGSSIGLGAEGEQ